MCVGDSYVLECFSVVTSSMIHQKKRETERKVEHNYIPVFCLDIDLIWLKNVNSDAN